MSGKPFSECDFVVVGAGLAGLRTAIQLSASGAAVTVFEARQRVGGRVLSEPYPEASAGKPPLVLDLGAQWVGPGQTDVLRLIKELGLHTVATEVPGRALWDIDGKLKRGAAALPPLPPRALAELLTGGARLTLMSKQIAADTPWTTPNARKWDSMSAADWIARHLRTTAARELAGMYIKGNAAIEPGESSLLGILFDLRSVGPARHLGTAEAFRLLEGTHEIARRLAGKVSDRIHFGDPVRAITQDTDGVTVESETRVLRCRRVAVCVPPPLASKIAYTPALPDRRARLLDSLLMGAAVKFHAIYPRPFWRDAGLSGQAMSSTETVGLTYDNSPDNGTGRGALVGIVVADEARRLGKLDPERQERDILQSLGRLFGPATATPEAVVIQDWGAEEWTGGCYAAHFPVNVWTNYGSAFREPCGRIHWAGTETSSEWHGYMEGALRSGSRAASEMLQGDQIPGGGQ